MNVLEQDVPVGVSPAGVSARFTAYSLNTTPHAARGQLDAPLPRGIERQLLVRRGPHRFKPKPVVGRGLERIKPEGSTVLGQS